MIKIDPLKIKQRIKFKKVICIKNDSSIYYVISENKDGLIAINHRGIHRITLNCKKEDIEEITNKNVIKELVFAHNLVIINTMKQIVAEYKDTDISIGETFVTLLNALIEIGNDDNDNYDHYISKYSSKNIFKNIL